MSKAAAAVPERGYRSRTDFSVSRPPHWAADVDAADLDREVATADLVCVALPAAAPSYDSHAALRVLRSIRAVNPAAEVRLVSVPRLGASALVCASGWEETDAALVSASSRSMVRRHLQYNYVANAQVIMGLTAQAAAGRNVPSLASPHQLQLLFHIRASGAVTEDDLRLRMATWRGTGKYPQIEVEPPVGFGSQFFRNRMVGTLVEDGVLAKRPTGDLCVSDLGNVVLDAMHPDCEDPDQVLRLERWATLPLDVAAQKIDRYVRTFFGKQKRRLFALS